MIRSLLSALLAPLSLNRRTHSLHQAFARPIVSDQGNIQRALCVTIAIMTFLACLALTGVNLISQSAHSWTNQIAREATIQILPVDGCDMHSQLAQALHIVESFPGVRNAHIVDEAATQHLLSPWLGAFSLKDLPLPRLIIVSIDEENPPDFALIAQSIKAQVKGASFDNHRLWMRHLSDVAHSFVIIGVLILFLVLCATVLTIVFATRSALSSNGETVEVLHFIGAESVFIAKQFDLYFLKTSLKGALYGGGMALLCFYLFSVWWGANISAVKTNTMGAFLGTFHLSWLNYGEMLLLMVGVCALCIATNHFTLLKQIQNMDEKEAISHKQPVFS